jgi:hypothetical protein
MLFFTKRCFDSDTPVCRFDPFYTVRFPQIQKVTMESQVHQPGRIMFKAPQRAVFAACLFALLAAGLHAATLEKLSVEEMAQKSTLIVRGRVTGCAGETRGPVIYTRCSVAVSESWKGHPGTQISFVVPGGTAQGLTQTFTGTPKFDSGTEYVLFLWAGRSGTNQVIGLSQGIFDLKTDGKGAKTARREASAEVMLDSAGSPVKDQAVELKVTELHDRVRGAVKNTAGARQ